MTGSRAKKVERAVGELARELERVEKVKRIQQLMKPTPAEHRGRARHLRAMGFPEIARMEDESAEKLERGRRAKTPEGHR